MNLLSRILRIRGDSEESRRKAGRLLRAMDAHIHSGFPDDAVVAEWKRYVEGAQATMTTTELVRDLQRIIRSNETMLTSLSARRAVMVRWAIEDGESTIRKAEGNGLTVEPPVVMPRIPLGLFRWLCRGESREIVDQTRDDLRRDAREMLREGRKRSTVRLVLCWRSLICAATIAGPGLLRTVRFMQEVKKLFSRTPPSPS